MSIEDALSRDLRRLRRAAALFMVFLLLLPWFFRYVPLSYPNWRLPRAVPTELPEPQPVPETYPIPVQWIPAPMEVVSVPGSGGNSRAIGLGPGGP